MAIDDFVAKADAQTTRRTVVKTGVKLVYAAPLVAATFKLRSGDAGAQAVSQNCPCFSDCGGDENCFCVTNVDSLAYCSNNIACADTTTCTTDGDCPANWRCQGGRCPGACGQVCIPECGAGGFSDGSGFEFSGLSNRP